MHNIEYKSGSSKYETTMNIFSTMDSWEKEKHLGLGKNISQWVSAEKWRIKCKTLNVDEQANHSANIAALKV